MPHLILMSLQFQHFGTRLFNIIVQCTLDRQPMMGNVTTTSFLIPSSPFLGNTRVCNLV
jgi:hypothetical protein